MKLAAVTVYAYHLLCEGIDLSLSVLCSKCNVLLLCIQSHHSYRRTSEILYSIDKKMNNIIRVIPMGVCMYAERQSMLCIRA